MRTSAVLVDSPGRIALAEVDLTDPAAGDLVVDTAFTGISTGTEKLLWQGRMPAFPGLGYPLVPGYEAVGTVVDATGPARRWMNQQVFVPGARCYRDVRALFGGSAARLVVPAERVVRNPFADERGTLLALAATAHHALAAPGAVPPDLVIGHGVVGRLLARLAIARGAAPPTVLETDPARRGGGFAYPVLDPAEAETRDARAIYDCSGDPSVVDACVGRLAKGGEIVLAGFYAAPVSFAFPPAFTREMRLRVAAEWQASDMDAVLALVEAGRLSLDGLVSDRRAATDAPAAYAHAFAGGDCLKMILDWRPA